MAAGCGTSRSVKGLSIDDLADYLLLGGISGDTVDKLKDHGVGGDTLLEMTDEHLKEVAPKIADRVNLKKIVSAKQTVWGLRELVPDISLSPLSIG